LDSNADIPLISPSPGTPAGGRPLLAVLPFKPAHDDEQLHMLGQDAAQQLRESLCQLPQFATILISSDFLAKAPPHALELICRQLGVGHVITGKCYMANGTPLLFIELTDSRTWHILWAHHFKGDVHALAAPGSEAMESLVATLQLSLRRHLRN